MDKYLDYVYAHLTIEEKMIIDRLYKAGTLYQSDINNDIGIANLVAYRIVNTTSFYGVKKFDILSLSSRGVALYEEYILPNIKDMWEQQAE